MTMSIFKFYVQRLLQQPEPAQPGGAHRRRKAQVRDYDQG